MVKILSTSTRMNVWEHVPIKNKDAAQILVCHTSELIGDCIYFIGGGQSDILRYDILTTEMTRVKVKSSTKPIRSTFMSSTCKGNTIYTLVEDQFHKIEIPFDDVETEWIALPLDYDKVGRRYKNTLLFYKQYVVVFGGFALDYQIWIFTNH